MTTTVVNIKNLDPYDVYIGRPSKWGNPFKNGEYYQGRYMTRHDAIEAYRDWFLYSSQGVELQKDIAELKDKILGCHCKPLACHGDFLAEFVNMNLPEWATGNPVMLDIYAKISDFMIQIECMGGNPEQAKAKVNELIQQQNMHYIQAMQTVKETFALTGKI